MKELNSKKVSDKLTTAEEAISTLVTQKHLLIDFPDINIDFTTKKGTNLTFTRLKDHSFRKSSHTCSSSYQDNDDDDDSQQDSQDGEDIPLMSTMDYVIPKKQTDGYTSFEKQYFKELKDILSKYGSQDKRENVSKMKFHYSQVEKYKKKHIGTNQDCIKNAGMSRKRKPDDELYVDSEDEKFLIYEV